MPELLLGTANFGDAYGIANNGQRLTYKESKDIVVWAQKNGINRFDTAYAYHGASEILGSSLDQTRKPSVDTKLDSASCLSSKLIVEKTEALRASLGVSQISVLYLHNEEILFSSLQTEVVQGLKEVLKCGMVEKIGVSVYSESAVIESKKVLPELSVFQVPENICDRRLISSRWIQTFANEGAEFIVRSIFLQGLLLMDLELIPQRLSLAKPIIESLTKFAEKNSITVMDLCMAYVHSIKWASGIIVGVASLEQLAEVKKFSATLPFGWNNEIKTLPEKILDPRNWNL
jgi:aryl-alcohol dehydrogenase-like predicted oxidoreductase